MDKIRKKQPKGNNIFLKEWSRTGSFMNKPEVGWIHPDAQLSPDAGICYGVRYIGCLEIKESMKTLDFDTRTTIARESINRVAEAAGLKTASKRKKIDRRLAKMMGDLPHMQYAGSNVNLTITTDSINLMIMESGEIIADHPLHVVSFASGGDVFYCVVVWLGIGRTLSTTMAYLGKDTLDFVSYVAKDPEYGRACHVLECGGGLAEDVVTTIGQAFELRFKQYLKKQPKAVQLPDRQDNPGFEDEKWGNSEDYYNDNPDAIPPGMEAAAAMPSIPPRPDFAATGSSNVYSGIKDEGTYDQPQEDSQSLLTPYDNKVSLGEVVDDKEVTEGGIEYDNKTKHLTEQNPNSQNTDAFDMEPFSVDLPPPPVPPSVSPSRKSHKGNETDLRENKSTSSESLEPVFEEWYHGDLPRKQAESMLEFDGDFLVRKSTNSPGQFVLSGKQSGAPRHLLLVDPEGIVRTRDFIFDSVSHLINYHRQNNLPIVTQGSELQLVRPVKTTVSAI